MTITLKSAAWTEYHPAVYTDGLNEYTATRDQDTEDPREDWGQGPALVDLNDPDDSGRYDDCPAIRVLKRLASEPDGDSVTLAKWEEACKARGINWFRLCLKRVPISPDRVCALLGCAVPIGMGAPESYADEYADYLNANIWIVENLCSGLIVAGIRADSEEDAIDCFIKDYE